MKTGDICDELAESVGISHESVYTGTPIVNTHETHHCILPMSLI